ncbi:MAG TPA: FGGY-family carbohydrate kinase [Chloroflexota bacterium]|nr:FGGY-family carbohydrate kinase [Chloroflexota bacterium]
MSSGGGLELFAGIDLGTARVKVGIFDQTGSLHAMRIIPHAGRLTPERGAVTQDAAAWWAAVCAALRATSAFVGASQITAVAVCGQGPTLVATDSRLRPRGPALTWMDKRAQAEAAELSARLGRPVDAGHYVAKALRLHRTDPDPRRRWYFQSWDYLASLLSGIPHASSTWFEDEIAQSGLPRDHFPPYIEAGTPVGAVTAAAARRTGLREGTLVVAGTNDGIASCIGAGLTRVGQSVILGGTSGGFVHCGEPAPGVWAPPPGTYPEPPGCRYLGATISSSGLALDWLGGLFGVRSYDNWLEDAAAIPAGAEGLLLLPYLAGLFLPYTADDRGPVCDADARGVLFGLRATHTTPHLVRAVVEGVTYAIRQVYEATVAAGVATSAVTVGGQAHSPLWNQIKADVLDLPVEAPAVVEAGALGAACMAASGSGRYPSMWEAARAMVSIRERLEPNPLTRAHYQRLYSEVYLPLYPRVRDLFKQLS